MMTPAAQFPRSLLSSSWRRPTIMSLLPQPRTRQARFCSPMAPGQRPEA